MKNKAEQNAQLNMLFFIQVHTYHQQKNTTSREGEKIYILFKIKTES